MRGKRIIVLMLAVFCFLLLPAHTPAQAPPREQQSVTVPLFVEHNRPFIYLEFTRPDGKPRRALFWVDTGGGGFIMVEPLARELGLRFGQEVAEGGERFAATDTPKAQVGGMPLNLEGARASIALGQRMMTPGVPAEGLLPARVLRNYHVIFDYPGHQFTLAKPGSVKQRGVRVASPIHPQSGFPRLEVQVGGQPYGFLLDTGASFTMISQEVLNQWGALHADWPQATGAVGAANMGLGPMEVNALMMRIPELTLGTFQLKSVAAVSRPKGTFERWMSGMMTSPIIGAIGGNVWKTFRVEIDYASGETFLEQKAASDPHDLDIVGVTLRAHADGSYTILGASKLNGKDALDGPRPGDKLIRIDRLDVTGAPLFKVVDTLRGKPHQKRTLVIERGGKQIKMKVPVSRVL